MATIVTRTTNGKPLTWAEADANFNNLNTDKLEINPALGTPVSGVLTNVTGLPVSTGVSGLGTGVATALAVNVGSAGAPVVLNGALGTPTSGVATNLTGTAAGLTAGTVSTNANLTGHVTSVGNATVLGSFTHAQLNTAVSDANLAAAGANSDITSIGTVTGIGNGRGTDITINSSGAVTKPLQPCFSALVSANIANVTGDGTAYTVIFDSEVFDVAGNLASGVFTSPVTGKFHMGGVLYVYVLTRGTTSVTINIVTSNRIYSCVLGDQFGGYSYIPFGFPSIDMDAGDTAYVTLTVSGTTKTIAIGGSYSRFAGHLVC